MSGGNEQEGKALGTFTDIVRTFREQLYPVSIPVTASEENPFRSSAQRARGRAETASTRQKTGRGSAIMVTMARYTPHGAAPVRGEPVNMAEGDVHIAVEKGDVARLRELLDCGAGVEYEAKADGSTPLQKACIFGRAACVALLLERGANVDKGNAAGYTSLYRACVNNYPECVRLLLEHGANVNKAANGSWSSLHFSCLFGRAECARLLLEYGADASRLTDSGETPLQIARSKGHAACVDVLEQAQARRAIARARWRAVCGWARARAIFFYWYELTVHQMEPGGAQHARDMANFESDMRSVLPSPRIGRFC